MFVIQSWIYAHHQPSVLDEGAYLYKGLLFVTGQYKPFQDYGPWSNHMPFSFLIPGFVQWVFGPGLRTGRYFAILLGILMLIGLWKIAKELGGRWWAALAIWAIALNPWTVQTYSLAVSQGLVACMLVWILVLVLGERRSIWQLAVGSSLAGLLLVFLVAALEACLIHAQSLLLGQLDGQREGEAVGFKQVEGLGAGQDILTRRLL